jgi:hypothetical protein
MAPHSGAHDHMHARVRAHLSAIALGVPVVATAMCHGCPSRGAAATREWAARKHPTAVQQAGPLLLCHRRCDCHLPPATGLCGVRALHSVLNFEINSDVNAFTRRFTHAVAGWMGVQLDGCLWAAAHQLA